MPKNLVIVESPSKSKTIEKYLGKDFHVVSSKGHIRDLATTGKYGLGVDVDNDFKPTYVPIEGKQKMIAALKKDVKEASKVYLATDPDREGEAISWHLKDALGIKDSDYDRVLFHEITKDKVIEAFKEPRKIDYNLVKSQETRRILDRIIGFRLSKLMQSKTGGKSAGRVQSVALKLIVDREREINAFKKEEYWTIDAIFKDFEASLFAYKNKDIKVVKNNNSEFGISQSIKLGVSNSSNNIYMFIVCDQPYIKKETIDKFINQFVKSKKNLGCVSNNDILLNPTIFTSKYKQKLLNLSGDKGGKKIILENLNDLFTFKILSEKEVIDIDFKYQL